MSFPATRQALKGVAKTEAKLLAKTEVKELAKTELKALAKTEAKELAKTEVKALAEEAARTSSIVEIGAGGNTVAKVTVGGGATTARIAAEHARAIQEFVDRYQVEVTVVGSRVNPNKALTPGQSDWDYLINPIEGVKPTKSLREVENSATKYLPRGSRRIDELGNSRNGMDLQRNEPVDPSLPQGEVPRRRLLCGFFGLFLAWCPRTPHLRLFYSCQYPGISLLPNPAQQQHP
jgi:hypothetical protein